MNYYWSEIWIFHLSRPNLIIVSCYNYKCYGRMHAKWGARMLQINMKCFKQTLKNIMLHSSFPKFKGIYWFIGRNRSLKLKKWQTRARPQLPLLQQVILPKYSTNRSQIKTKMDEWRQEKLTKTIYRHFTVDKSFWGIQKSENRFRMQLPCAGNFMTMKCEIRF